MTALKPEYLDQYEAIVGTIEDFGPGEIGQTITQLTRRNPDRGRVTLTKRVKELVSAGLLKADGERPTYYGTYKGTRAALDNMKASGSARATTAKRAAAKRAANPPITTANKVAVLKALRAMPAHDCTDHAAFLAERTSLPVGHVNAILKELALAAHADHRALEDGFVMWSITRAGQWWVERQEAAPTRPVDSDGKTSGNDAFLDRVADFLGQTEKPRQEASVIAAKFGTDTQAVNDALTGDSRFSGKWGKHPKTGNKVCLWALASRLEDAQSAPEAAPAPEPKAEPVRAPEAAPEADDGLADFIAELVRQTVADNLPKSTDTAALEARIAELEAANAGLMAEFMPLRQRIRTLEAEGVKAAQETMAALRRTEEVEQMLATATGKLRRMQELFADA